MSKKRLKVAYLSEIDPNEPWGNSGGNIRTFQALKKHVGDVTVLNQNWGVVDFVRKLIDHMPFNYRIRLRWRLQLLFSKFIAKSFAKELRKEKFDVLFCAYSFYYLHNLRPPYPMLVVFTSDASYTSYKNSEIGGVFKSYFPLSKLLDSYIFNAEKKVYKSVDLLLWPSQWMVNETEKLYKPSKGRMHLVRYGGSITTPPISEIKVQNSISGSVQLLFVGRDWLPKGGAVVFDILKNLIDLGVDAHLTVVGCIPPEPYSHEKMTVHAYLNKHDPEQLSLFKSLYRNAHFFVMPSYESYGFAFCEASAYALPVVCLRVCGIPVLDNVNGCTLPEGASSADFAEKIIGYIENPAKYEALRISTRNFHEEELNWDAWGEKTSILMHEKMASLTS